MANLKQNNLSEATTDLGFVRAINENVGDTIAQLERNVTLEDGTVVKVEGVTPSKMKNILNSLLDEPEKEITYLTPGENVEDIKGVVQQYNSNIPETTRIQIISDLKLEHGPCYGYPFLYKERTYWSALVFKGGVAPYKVRVIDKEGNDVDFLKPELLSTSGGVTQYTLIGTNKTMDEKYNIDDVFEAQAIIEDSLGQVVYGKVSSFKIKDVPASIKITKDPDKIIYTVGETFDTTGMEVTAVYNNASGDFVVDERVVTDYTYTPTEALTIDDNTITVEYGSTPRTTTVSITVNEVTE